MSAHLRSSLFSAGQKAGRALSPGGTRGGNVGAANVGRIDWPLTLRNGKPTARKALVYRQRKYLSGELWIIVLDASASMRRDSALTKAKGVLGSLLSAAYQARIQVALVEVSGGTPLWHSHGKRPPKNVIPVLDAIGAGGGTPLSEALKGVDECFHRRHRQHPQEHHRLFLLTDGRVKVMPSVSFMHTKSLLIDMESGAVRLERARQMSEILNLQYVHIDQIPEQQALPEHRSWSNDEHE